VKGIVKESSAPGATLESHLLDPRSGEGEIVVKVESAAICGTDLHIYKWNPWARARVRPPMVFGHEFSGVVIETGDLGQIIAAKYPFEEFQSAFEAAIGGILGKVILVP